MELSALYNDPEESDVILRLICDLPAKTGKRARSMNKAHVEAPASRQLYLHKLILMQVLIDLEVRYVPC